MPEAIKLECSGQWYYWPVCLTQRRKKKEEVCLVVGYIKVLEKSNTWSDYNH